MRKLLFTRIIGEVRHAHCGALGYAEGLPRAANHTYRQLKSNFGITGNSGNMMIGESTVRLFKCDRSRSCYNRLFPLYKQFQDKAELSRGLASAYDGIVMAVANFINPQSDLTDWADIVETFEDIDLYLFSGGLQFSTDFKTFTPQPSLQRFLDLVDEKATIFGVRGAKTEAFLRNELGMKSPVAVGCTSMYVYPENILSLEPPKKIERIATAAHLDINSAPQKKFAKAFSKVNVPVDYFLQDEIFLDRMQKYFKDDDIFYNDALGRFNADFLGDVFHYHTGITMPFVDYYYFNTPDGWRNHMKQYDVYIGERFHCGVVAMHAGIPSIIVVNDIRVLELVEHFGIPHCMMSDIHRKGPLNIIKDTFGNNLALDKFKTRYKEQLQKFLDVTNHGGLELTYNANDFLK